MVTTFQSFGTGPQLMSKNKLMAGRTLQGHAFEVVELAYNAPVAPGAQTNVSYAVDVAGVTDGPQTYGFATREDAERFIHSNTAEEYDARDMHGNTGKVSRVGLGVPEGMVSRLDGSAPPSMRRALEAQELALRQLAERGPVPERGQVPANPDVKPSSNPPVADWPTVTVPIIPSQESGPEPLGQEPPGTEESVSDGSDVTNPDLDKTGYDTDPEI